MTRPAWDPRAWDQSYSDLLYRSAERWGIPVPPPDDRPLIRDDKDAPYGGCLPIVEELQWEEKDRRYNYVRINVIAFGGLWSYSLNLQVHGAGHAYGPCMKFCTPYPTRIEALDAAATNLVEYLSDRMKQAPGLLDWLESIRAPVQLAIPGALV